MRLLMKQTLGIVSGLAVVSMAVLGGMLLDRLLERAKRRRVLTDSLDDQAEGFSIIEDLVAHNTKGF